MTIRSLLLIVCLFLLSGLGKTQTKSRQVPDTLQTADTSLTIITKVPFNGRYYFIRIVPVDSGNPDNMPIVGPGNRNRNYIWDDSLQGLLPDSVLKYLEKLRPKP